MSTRPDISLIASTPNAGAADTTFGITRADAANIVPRLAITAPEGSPALSEFEGERSPLTGQTLLLGPLSPKNAAALRRHLPWLQPVLLGTRTSAGMGDRLGSATPGHIRAVRATGSTVAPILAQQSIREMTRTNRTPQQVVDAATWGVFAENWRGGYGADADHLKTTEDIDRCVAAGFTFFTIDPSAHVDTAADKDSLAVLTQKVAQLPWAVLDSSPEAMRAAYVGREFALETRRVGITEEQALRAAAKYGAAVAHVVTLFRHLKAAGAPFELEISVDETDAPTTHAEHLYVVNELKRLGVTWVSLAPRYVGSFEKGVEYIGDLGALRTDLTMHAEIARANGGYKLSLHSGSDKFLVYPIIAELTHRCVHLKTAGTSYLEALRVIAMRAPALFRDIMAFAVTRFEVDRASYHISAELSKLPPYATMPAAELPGLMDERNARQVAHVTFGSSLLQFGPQINSVLLNHASDYADVIERHFIKHLAPFA